MRWVGIVAMIGNRLVPAMEHGDSKIWDRSADLVAMVVVVVVMMVGFVDAPAVETVFAETLQRWGNEVTWTDSIRVMLRKKVQPLGSTQERAYWAGIDMGTKKGQVRVVKTPQQESREEDLRKSHRLRSQAFEAAWSGHTPVRISAPRAENSNEPVQPFERTWRVVLEDAVTKL